MVCPFGNLGKMGGEWVAKLLILRGGNDWGREQVYSNQGVANGAGPSPCHI